MPSSWWDLGEHSGQRGADLATYQITCAFCLERGNWEIVHHAVKQKPNSSKTLNFDTLRCGNCSGYVMVLWSTSEFMPHDPLHDFRILPLPNRLEEHPAHWPADVGRFWIQSHRTLADENWDAAALMARSALQTALRGAGATGASLRAEIDDLSTRGVLPPHMRDWAHELRELGNESAHPQPGGPPTEPSDARDIVEFLDFLLQYLYDLPHQIDQYRARRRGEQEQ